MNWCLTYFKFPNLNTNCNMKYWTQKEDHRGMLRCDRRSLYYWRCTYAGVDRAEMYGRFWDTTCVFGLVNVAQIPPCICGQYDRSGVTLRVVSLCSISTGFIIVSSLHILSHVWWLPACCSTITSGAVQDVFLFKKKSSGSARSGSWFFLATSKRSSWSLVHWEHGLFPRAIP